jgi:hypothetical protein
VDDVERCAEMPVPGELSLSGADSVFAGGGVWDRVGLEEVSGNEAPRMLAALTVDEELPYRNSVTVTCNTVVLGEQVSASRT